MQETQEVQVQFLGSGRFLEEDMATPSSILAWRIPWTEEPDGLQSIGLQKVKWLNEHTLPSPVLSCHYVKYIIFSIIFSDIWILRTFNNPVLFFYSMIFFLILCFLILCFSVKDDVMCTKVECINKIMVM